MSISYDEWSIAIDRVVQRALELAEIDGPPIDTALVAERLKHSVLIDDQLPSRGYRKQVGGDTYIVLSPDERTERMHFAAAHELGEGLAAGVCRLIAGLDPDDMDARLREDLANRIASRLLCPNPWFAEVGPACDFDLLYLKAIFTTASHEVLARRLLDLDVPTVVTIFANGSIYLRLANFPNRPPITAIERECRIRCNSRAGPVTDEADGLRVQAWPIYEDGWEREIIRTTPVDTC